MATEKYALTLLLNAYKTGYFVIDPFGYSAYARAVLKGLQDKKLIELMEFDEHPEATPRLPATPGKFAIVKLTDEGVGFVKGRFLQELKTAHLFQIYPILVVNDRVRVTKTVENTAQIEFVKDHDTLPEGLYTIHEVGAANLLIVSEETNEKYRVKMQECREILHLQLDQIGTIDEELERRFGIIRIRALSKHLIKVEYNNFRLIDLINRLKESAVAKGRIGA